MTKEIKEAKVANQNPQQTKLKDSDSTDHVTTQKGNKPTKKRFITTSLYLICMASIILVCFLLLRGTPQLISFSDAVDVISEKTNNIWHYSGTIQTSCIFDESSLTRYEIQTPSDKNDSIYCKTNTISGKYKPKKGKLEIEYPEIDSYSVTRAKLMMLSKGSITDKREIKDYTLDLVVDDGVISFARDFENITEDGIVQTAKQDKNGKYTASPQQINGDKGTTYPYRFTLRDESNEVIAIYDLKLVVKLNNEDSEVLKTYQTAAQNKRAEIKAELDNAPMVSFDELAKNFGRYKDKIIKIRGTITETGKAACSLDVPRTPIKFGPMDLDKGMIFGRDCLSKGLNGMSISVNQNVTFVGKPYQIIEDDKIFGPFIYLDTLEVSK